ncbi:TPA: hypothetical protein ACRTTK_003068 [Aeromonas hydrophila]|uniref:phage tail protein n=1 Tax=Aeromonas hydrophila TaxID=644 RepID=UPI002441CC47|nr:phage tail protein [Aeromonas hydrophila]
MFRDFFTGSRTTPSSATPSRPTSQSGLLSRQRRMAHQLVMTPFQQGWQYRVEVSGMPADFDIYVKDITYGSFQIEYEAKEIGTLQVQNPTHRTAGLVTLTVRDHQDARVENFFTKAANRVVNPDGTVNLPKDYLLNMRLYLLQEDGGEKLYKEWDVAPAECGDITRTRSALSEFVSFPISFQKYRSASRKE